MSTMLGLSENRRELMLLLMQVLRARGRVEDGEAGGEL